MHLVRLALSLSALFPISASFPSFRPLCSLGTFSRVPFFLLFRSFRHIYVNIRTETKNQVPTPMKNNSRGRCSQGVEKQEREREREREGETERNRTHRRKRTRDGIAVHQAFAFPLTLRMPCISTSCLPPDLFLRNDFFRGNDAPVHAYATPCRLHDPGEKQDAGSFSRES